jgi:hypothetical protein
MAVRRKADKSSIFTRGRSGVSQVFAGRFIRQGHRAPFFALLSASILSAPSTWISGFPTQGPHDLTVRDGARFRKDEQAAFRTSGRISSANISSI